MLVTWYHVKSPLWLHLHMYTWMCEVSEIGFRRSPVLPIAALSIAVMLACFSATHVCQRHPGSMSQVHTSQRIFGHISQRYVVTTLSHHKHESVNRAVRAMLMVTLIVAICDLYALLRACTTSQEHLLS